MVGILAGYQNLNTKTFQNSVSALRTAGLITYPDSESMALTEAGMARSKAQTPPTLESFQSKIKSLVEPKAAQILDVLISRYPRSMLRSELGAAVGYANLNTKTFQNSISKLRTLGFADYPSSTEVVGTPLLFMKES